MKQVTLKVNRRETGKRSAKLIRREGLVPGVYYSNGEETIPIVANPLSLRPIIYTAEARLINLEVEGDGGQPKECVLQEVKFDPLTDKVIHFDLHGVSGSKNIFVDVPVVLKGQSIGVREGGLLLHNLHKVHVSCLPHNIPNAVEIDISGLHMGKSIHAKDLSIEGVEILVPGDTVVVSVVHPRVGATEKTTTEAEATAAQPKE